MSNVDELLRACVSAVQSNFDEKAEEFKNIMKAEAHKVTGNLSECIYKEKLSDTQYVVGVDGKRLESMSRNGFDYSRAYWKGRKTVKPKPENKSGRLHFKVDGKWVRPKEAKATSGDPFVERAIRKLK